MPHEDKFSFRLNKQSRNARRKIVVQVLDRHKKGLPCKPQLLQFDLKFQKEVLQ